MKILLDPGHGGRDPGAIGALPGANTGSNLQEKDVTLTVAKLAAEELRERGYTVLLTRETDEAVPLHTRTAMAVAEKVDAYLSIHANAGGGTGCEVWYQAGDESSRAFAAALEKGIRDVDVVPNRGLKAGSAATRTNWYTFSQLANDALLELAFLDHPGDARQLHRYPERFARGIANAIEAHLPLAVDAQAACDDLDAASADASSAPQNAAPRETLTSTRRESQTPWQAEKQEIIAQRDAMLAEIYAELMADRTDLAYAIRLANGARNTADLGGMTRAERLRELNEKWAGKI